MNRYTIWRVTKGRREPINPVYTGTHSECLTVLREMILRGGWPRECLQLIDHTTEQGVEYSLIPLGRNIWME